MRNDQQAGQPIPSDFIEWANNQPPVTKTPYRQERELMTAWEAGYEEGQMDGAIATYRHLHSQPSSSVGNTIAFANLFKNKWWTGTGWIEADKPERKQIERTTVELYATFAANRSTPDLKEAEDEKIIAAISRAYLAGQMNTAIVDVFDEFMHCNEKGTDSPEEQTREQSMKDAEDTVARALEDHLSVPTQKPTHVSDSKGEIPESPAEYISRSTAEAQKMPEEIANFIKSISSGYGSDCNIIAACAKLYHKMQGVFVEHQKAEAWNGMANMLIDDRQHLKVQIATLTQQREETITELEQVKMSFHQSVAEVKRLTAQLTRQ